MKSDITETTKEVISSFGDVLGIEQLAKAKTKEELIQAFETARSSFQDMYDHHALLELQELAKEIDAGKNSDEATKAFIDKQQEAMMINGVVNGKVVEGSVNTWHQKQVLKLRKQLIAEYQVTGVSELMIIDLAINAYFRSLHSSRLYSCVVQKPDATMSFDHPRINMLKELNKQIENANRQYISAITLLKELKQPAINIKVQSKQAFVGQNQQFNKNA